MEIQLPTWLESFEHNPLPHLEAFVLGLLSLALAIAALRAKNATPQPKLALGLGAVAGSLGALACGVFGYMTEVAHWREAIGLSRDVTPADVDRLHRVAEQAARWPLVSGAGAAALPFALGLFAVFISRARPRPNLPPPAA